MLDYISTLQEELVRATVLPSDYDFEAHRELVGMQPGDVPVTYADSKGLEEDYGFKPTIGIRYGLRKFAEWYKEYFNNIVANLKHENSQHLALAVFIKAHNLKSVQVFLLLRLLVKTALGPCTWDSRMKTYLERGQVIFSEKELESLFIGLKGNEIRAVSNVFEYSRRCINLNRCFVYVKQFLGVLPQSNEVRQ